jgi:hypothetical protein
MLPWEETTESISSVSSSSPVMIENETDHLSSMVRFHS